jgi:tRNA(Ile2) C34 agmatinyltransferase TiaS
MMSWLVGIDDTDTSDTPGTNKLALHLADQLSESLRARLIVRHQLLVDPRVPYTSHNGCVSLLLETLFEGPDKLADMLAPEIVAWCPQGSDPGLCIANSDSVGAAIVQFGQLCQEEVVDQGDARRAAAESGLHLECLGGTGDGVIGALAAVGLLATRNDGRILHADYGGTPPWSEITGWQTLDDLLRAGVCEVRRVDTSEAVRRGRVLLAKRLRPNLCQGRAVLFVERAAESTTDDEAWQAVKLV